MSGTIQEFIDDIHKVAKIDDADGGLVDAVINKFCDDNFKYDPATRELAETALKIGLHSAMEDGLSKAEIIAAISQTGEALYPAVSAHSGMTTTPVAVDPSVGEPVSLPPTQAEPDESSPPTQAEPGESTPPTQTDATAVDAAPTSADATAAAPDNSAQEIAGDMHHLIPGLEKFIAIVEMGGVPSAVPSFERDDLGPTPETDRFDIPADDVPPAADNMAAPSSEGMQGAPVNTATVGAENPEVVGGGVTAAGVAAIGVPKI